MTTYTFCVMPDGKLPTGIRETLAKLFPAFAGKKLRLTVQEAKDKRSLDQNALYWGVIVPHVRAVRFDMGDALSIEQVHEDLLDQFAPAVDAKNMLGSKYIRPMRSKEMSVVQFATYITAITGTMAEFGYPVPQEVA